MINEVSPVFAPDGLEASAIMSTAHMQPALSHRTDDAGLIAAPPVDIWADRSTGSGRHVIDFSTGLAFIRRNLLKILLAATSAGVALVVAFLLVFNTYSATALILIDPRDTKVTQSTEVLSNIGPDAIAIESLVQVANSDGFLGKVVDTLNLAEDSEFASAGTSDEARRPHAIDKLKRSLKVARSGMTYVIEVTANTRTSQGSARIANTAAQMIIDDQTNLRSGSTEKASAWIDGHIGEMHDRLHKAEETVAALKAKLKITDAGQGVTLQERRVLELNQQLALANARTSQARALFEHLRDAKLLSGNEMPGGTQAPVLSALRQEYSRLTRQAAEQATVYGERYPGLQSSKAQITDAKREIDAEIGRLKAAAKSDFMQAQSNEATLSRQLQDTQTESGELGRQVVELDEVEREAKATRAVYEQMLTRQKELVELQNLTPTDIRIASPATAPLQVNRPKWALAGPACLLLGLLIGLVFAAASERIRQSRPALR